MVKNCLKSSLELLNYSIGLGGIAIITYGVLMIRAWQPDEGEGSSSHRITIPWFFHAFIGVGIALCAVTCLGHVAANTANVYCLSSYIIIILLLLILESIIMADVFLNPTWEKELPKYLYERVDDFKDFVESDDEIWKWVAWLVFLVQSVCVLLATILRTHQKTSHEVDIYESEDEDLQSRTPLLVPSALRRTSHPSIV